MKTTIELSEIFPTQSTRPDIFFLKKRPKDAVNLIFPSGPTIAQYTKQSDFSRWVAFFTGTFARAHVKLENEPTKAAYEASRNPLALRSSETSVFVGRRTGFLLTGCQVSDRIVVNFVICFGCFRSNLRIFRDRKWLLGMTIIDHLIAGRKYV